MHVRGRVVTDAALIPLMIKSARAALESGQYSIAADVCRALDALTVHQAVQDGARIAFQKEISPEEMEELKRQFSHAIRSVPLIGQTRDEQPSSVLRYECVYCGTPAQEFQRLGDGQAWRHDMHVTSEGYPYNPIVPHEPVRPS